MTARQVSIRFRPDPDPNGQARLFDLIATGLDRYLRTKVDFATDARMYVAMAPDASEAIRW